MRKTEQQDSTRWIVPYADLVTLLLGLFIVLYAASKTDAHKYKKVALSVSSAFGEKNEDPFAPPIPPQDKIMDETSIAGEQQPLKKVSLEADAELQAIAEELRKAFRVQLGMDSFGNKLEMLFDDRGFVIRLSADDFFPASEAAVKNDLLPILDTTALVLKGSNHQIRVEGHTDNLPIRSEVYSSNWELSTARASWIVRYFIKKFEFNGRKLLASGMAEYHPIDANDTEAGRSRNRRVEVIVLPNPKSPQPVKQPQE